MSAAILFLTDLSLDLDYIEKKGDEMYECGYIKPGTVLTMKYTQSTEATVQVTLLSVQRVLEDPYLDIYLVGCVLKSDTPIHIYLQTCITLSIDETIVAHGYIINQIAPRNLPP
jgi:hypothetical protein